MKETFDLSLKENVNEVYWIYGFVSVQNFLPGGNVPVYVSGSKGGLAKGSVEIDDIFKAKGIIAEVKTKI